MNRLMLRFLMIVVLAPAVGTGTYAPSQLPKPDHYVQDYANVIESRREQELNGILQNLERTTGVQYIILTLNSTGGIPIADYCLELADNNWKLGQQDKDNGMLFVITISDRAYWFAPGRGFDGFLTDDYLDRLGKAVLVPYLKQDQYSEGIYAVNRDVVRRISEQLRATSTPIPDQRPVPTRSPMPVRPHAPARSPTPAQPYRPAITHSSGPSSGIPCFVVGFFALIVLLIIGVGMGRAAGMGGTSSLPLSHGFGGCDGHGRSGYFGGGPFGGGFGAFGGAMHGGIGRFGGFGAGTRSHLGGFGAGTRPSSGFGHFGGGGGGHFSGRGAGGRW